MIAPTPVSGAVMSLCGSPALQGAPPRKEKGVVMTTQSVKAECGHTLTAGALAYSHYVCEAGVIKPWKDLFAHDPSGPWFDFVELNGKPHLLNGDRICCLSCARRYGYPRVPEENSLAVWANLIERMSAQVS